MIRRIKNILKPVTSYFTPQRGAILTWLTIVGTTMLLGGLFYTGSKIKKIGEGMKDYTQNIHQFAETDYSKGEKSYIEARNVYERSVLKSYVEGGKTAATLYDDTGLLTIANDATWAFNIKKDKNKKSNENTGDHTDIFELWGKTDKLLRDVGKRISEVVEENISKGADKDKKEKAAKEILKQADQKRSSENPPDGSLAVYNIIKTELNKENILEDQKIIDKKLELEKLEQKKENLESMVGYYEYEPKAFVFSDINAYDALNKKLNEVNDDIEIVEGELKDYNQPIYIAETEEIEEVSGAGLGQSGVDTTEITKVVAEDGQEAVEEDSGQQDEGPQVPEEDTAEIQQQEQEEQTEQSGEIVNYKGAMYFEGLAPAEITMSINLGTGEVTGTYYDDQYFVSEGTISGTIWNGKIDALLTIEHKLDGETLATSQGKMSGTLSSDGSYASGTSEENSTWKVYRQ